MTRRIGQKLNSRDGVTVLFAMLGFLAAAMAAFVIVSAAINNESRIRGQREQQQTYLSMSSAASLLRGAVAGTRVGRIVEDENEEDAEYSCYGPKGALGTALIALSKGLVEGLPEGTKEQELTLTVAETGGTVGYGDMTVNISLALDKDRSRVTAVIVPQNAKDGSVITLVFSGLAWKLDYSVPHMVDVVDEEGNVYQIEDYMIDHYSLFFPEDGIYVQE